MSDKQPNKTHKPKPGAKPQDLAYYMTLFTLEGHTTWRGHFAADKDSFDKQLQPNTPKITDRRVYRIDRFTGEPVRIS